MSLAQSLGVKLDIVKTSWSTLKSDLEADRFDIAWAGSRSPSTTEDGTVLQPRLFERQDADHALWRRTEIWNDRGDRSTRCARIVNPGGTNERFDRAHLQNATIVPWSDNATIFDALVEGKADLMITDAVETKVQAKLHPGVLCPVHPNAPFDHSELAYWMPRDPIFAAYVSQWLNLLDLSGERQAILARWMP